MFEIDIAHFILLHSKDRTKESREWVSASEARIQLHFMAVLNIMPQQSTQKAQPFAFHANLNDSPSMLIEVREGCQHRRIE